MINHMCAPSLVWLCTFLPVDCAMKAMVAKYITFGFRTYMASQKHRGQGIDKVHPEDSEDQTQGERVKVNHIEVNLEGIDARESSKPMLEQCRIIFSEWIYRTRAQYKCRRLYWIYSRVECTNWPCRGCVFRPIPRVLPDEF